MAVANTNSSVSYFGHGVELVLPTGFKFLAETDLLVQKSIDNGVTWTTLVRGADYTVAGAGADEPGGTVTLAVALAFGALLSITRQTPVVQPVVLAQSGPLPVKSLTGELDRLTLIAQEQARQLAAVLAGGVGVTVAQLGAIAQKVQDTFAVAEPAENSFPRNVACVGTPVGVCIMRVEDLTDGTVKNYGLGAPDLGALTPNQFAVNFVPGLTPGHNTRITYLVITAL